MDLEHPIRAKQTPSLLSSDITVIRPFRRPSSVLVYTIHSLGKIERHAWFWDTKREEDTNRERLSERDWSFGVPIPQKE